MLKKTRTENATEHSAVGELLFKNWVPKIRRCNPPRSDVRNANIVPKP
jgi:hypothetical protein